MSLPAGTVHAHGRLRKKSRMKALESMWMSWKEWGTAQTGTWMCKTWVFCIFVELVQVTWRVPSTVERHPSQNLSDYFVKNGRSIMINRLWSQWIVEVALAYKLKWSRTNESIFDSNMYWTTWLHCVSRGYYCSISPFLYGNRCPPRTLLYLLPRLDHSGTLSFCWEIPSIYCLITQCSSVLFRMHFLEIDIYQYVFHITPDENKQLKATLADSNHAPQAQVCVCVCVTRVCMAIW